MLERLWVARAALATCDWEGAIEVLRQDVCHPLAQSPLALQLLARAYYESTNYNKVLCSVLLFQCSKFGLYGLYLENSIRV